MARLGTVLLVCGLLAVVVGAAWQFGLWPGSRISLPPPVALARQPTAAAVGPTATLLSPTEAAPSATERPPSPTPRAPGPTPVVPTATPAPLLTPVPGTRPIAADVGDRAALPIVRPGYAVRLAIPAIKLDTVVKQGGIVQDAQGNLTWQTLPFVAVHYGDLTSPLGVPGNAVIAGHVVTLNEGNVFRFLYQLDFDDRIDVWDQHDREHEYRVVNVKLVPPSDTSVMNPTPDETLTLITCGGTFDPIKREFSDRLIVTAKPVGPDPGQ